jgi:hypothetical protein
VLRHRNKYQTWRRRWLLRPLANYWPSLSRVSGGEWAARMASSGTVDRGGGRLHLCAATQGLPAATRRSQGPSPRDVAATTTSSGMAMIIGIGERATGHGIARQTNQLAARPQDTSTVQYVWVGLTAIVRVEPK